MPAIERAVSLIGLPYHMGVRTVKRDNEMVRAAPMLLAPDALPQALAGSVANISVTMLDDSDEPNAADTGGDLRLLPTGDQMGRILVQNRRLAREVKIAHDAGRFPLVVGTSCSSALGCVAGVPEGIGVIWFDAHGDAHTPDTSINGFIEAMPVSIIAGLAWPKWSANMPGFHKVPTERIITVGNHEIYASGGRSLEHNGNALGRVIDPPVIQAEGFEIALGKALDDLALRTKQVYVHFDADVLDPSTLKSNLHSADGGLTDAQCVTAFEMIAERFEIVAFNVAAWDPAVDPRGLEVLVPLITRATDIALSSGERAS